MASFPSPTLLWHERQVFNARRLVKETFNGASHSMPEGIRAKHYVRDDDLLVAQSIGMGKYTPEVRGIAGAGIDSALALINELPPDKREAAARDHRDRVQTAR